MALRFYYLLTSYMPLLIVAVPYISYIEAQCTGNAVNEVVHNMV